MHQVESIENKFDLISRFLGFVRVVQVLIPIGLAFACLALLTACSAFICTRAFITTVLFAGLFAFLSCK